MDRNQAVVPGGHQGGETSAQPVAKPPAGGRGGLHPSGHSYLWGSGVAAWPELGVHGREVACSAGLMDRHLQVDAVRVAGAEGVDLLVDVARVGGAVVVQH